MNSNEEAGSQRGARLDVRFAVVMYGGVSLAIYINGITQELLRLVRATALREEGGGNSAPAIANEDLRGTERVYRRLGRMISQNAETRRSEDVADDDPITTRFVVDVLAGTSAGGLNAIFLAKALANCQSLDELAHLWLEEGEIAKLINDKDSLDGLSGAKQQTPPRSLLNSNRMFRKLLAALDGMDASGRQCVESDGRTDGSERTRAGSGLTNAHAPSGNGAKRGADDLAATPSPLVEELDLFVTTTDLRGLRVDLRLADQIVQERRHRNVFHFEYRGGTRAQTVNDFVPSNNRFLAFAARCTSAFPVAFEPMTVDAAGLARPQAPATDADDSGWFKFFADYRRDLTDEKLESDLRDRSFADGGYLDNKPFGHAIEALRYRRGSIPVDRKLIYIEPSPDDLEASREPRNAIENGLSAFTLARYETIREDLQRVLARNRLIERVERIFSGLEMDLLRRAHDPEPLDREDYMGAGLRDMIGRQGIAYGGYHRLKVAKLTDEIANAIAVAAAFDPDSDQLLAIRNLVRVWRDENYAEDLPKNRDANTTERADGAPAREAPTMESVKTQNAFLVEYDLGFRLRRIAFVLDRLARIACRDDNAIDILRNGLKDSPTAAPDLRDVLDAPPAIELVAALSRRFSEIHAGLLRLREHLEARSDHHPLTALVLSTQLQTKDLLDTLRPRTDAGRLKEAWRIYRRDRGKFDEIAHELGRIIGNGIPAGAASSAFAGERVIGTREAADLVREALDGRVSGPAETVRTAVAYYYEAYDDYDLISFPILHATDAGEEMDMVDVVRFSPRDAPSLIDETSPAESRRKLAGTTLGNFGAFLDRGWRMNDILWGRLDGAERLIAMFVTDEDDRKRLTKEAHESILEEYVAEQCEPELCQTIADAFVAVKSNDRTENALRTALLDQAGAPVNHRLRAALERLLEKEKLRDFYETAYEVNRSLNPRRIVRAAARGMRVFGQILESIAEQYRVTKRPFAWFTKIAAVFWGIVQIAVPDSIGHILGRHWLRLLYAFDVLVISIGTVLLNPNVQEFGLMTLAITGALHFAIVVLGNYTRGGSGWKRWPRLTVATIVVLAVLAILGLAAIGTAALVFRESPAQLWTRLGTVASQAGRRVLFIGAAAGITAVVLLVLGAGRSIGRAGVRDQTPPPARRARALPALRPVIPPADGGQDGGRAAERPELEEAVHGPAS